MTNKPVKIGIVVLASVAGLLLVARLCTGLSVDSSSGAHPATSEKSSAAVRPVAAASEDAVPAGASDQTLSPQKVLSMLRGGAEEELGGLTVEDLFKESVPLAIRRKLAWRLVKNSKPDDMAVIWTYLSSPDTDSRVKAVLVEALGQSSDPQARDWLVSALDCGDTRIIRAALRGLAEMNDSRNAELFMNLFSSFTSSEDVRAAAAEALGKLSSVEGGQYLMQAWNGGGPEMRELVLQGLAHRSLDETAEFFGQVMAESSDPDLRRAVVEAASQASGDSAPFLLNCLNDADSEVRAEAAWGLSLHPDGNLASELLGRLDGEENTEVRSRLYAALSEQTGVDAVAVSEMAVQEKDDETRVSACLAACAHFDDVPESKQGAVEDVLLRELKQLVIGDGALNIRLEAVMGIRQLGTERAKKTLIEVVSGSYDPRIIDATGVDLGSLVGQ